VQMPFYILLDRCVCVSVFGEPSSLVKIRFKSVIFNLFDPMLLQRCKCDDEQASKLIKLMHLAGGPN